MRGTGHTRLLVARADSDPHTDGGGTHTGNELGDDAQAAGKDRALYSGFGSRIDRRFQHSAAAARGVGSGLCHEKVQQSSVQVVNQVSRSEEHTSELQSL